MFRPASVMLTALLAAGCAADLPAHESTPSMTVQPSGPVHAEMDPSTLQTLNRVLHQASTHRGLSPGHLIKLLSAEFLGTPYQANMLQGSATTPEQLIIDFRGLDCFTYLDYVEAARHAHSQQDFVDRVILTRYVDGIIGFTSRKHFFSDWVARPYQLADDITATLSPRAVSVDKALNLKADGSNYLPGLPVVQRSITYIPAADVDSTVVRRLRTGDYVGRYSPAPGLDVSHVGIFVMTDQGPVLRNASSRPENEKVVDSPFMEYVARTQGIVVYRPRP
ncbi:DUF1460 domain-containing protein [Xanthomonas hortorum]|uniref:Lipoprotein n=1 Tax=Xanthomonas hortorum pv. gardneri TaxID=2754056 RepID=A0A6V7C2M0_9XANT|nr:DUF1460 domain-containing protein [Xanthomonas hortorum]APP81805.1 hypothetical protein BJD10_20785 [Xanthomonas hortorum pv. gardneri]EGD19869.1 Protein of unknown function (DUF1460) [Xanthomonas hortorum ATCC 19865]KLA94643.1 lipoprotein [Xanthomonas hortorum pv. gardneri]KLA97865.1 lipoprotein [Xanthomonas hortorum pv. gardneri]KLA98841.1 lipoprotein [Xanthomonas hortorum pv. gardneri]